MQLFIDTANIEEIKKATELGVVSGVTTNPSLIAKEGLDIHEVIKQISKINDGPISAEVIATTHEEMVQEGRKLAAIADNIVIKVPMTVDGLKATAKLTELGIKTNVTLVFSLNQALLASQAGATYVSPFVGRLDDIDSDGVQLVADIVELFAVQAIETKIIAASIRTPFHASQVAMQGAHIATIPYNVILDMYKHPLTQSGLEKFLSDWDKVKNK